MKCGKPCRIIKEYDPPCSICNKLRNTLQHKIYILLLKLLSSKISYIIQFLVSVMSHCSQTFSVDFLEILLKRRHLKFFKKSPNKSVKNKNDDKEINDFNIDL